MCTERSSRSALRRSVARCVRSIAAVAVLSSPVVASADTVATLLGNFTVNQYCEVRLEPGKVDVGFVVVFGQLPALRELRAADVDRDGVTTQAERDAHVARLAPDFAKSLVLTVDGVRVPLAATRWTTSLPTEQSGFSMRLDVGYEGVLPATAAGSAATLRFENNNYAGQIGWHEIVVRPPDAIRVFDTDAFDSSLTNGLVDALTALPASGPLDERAIHLRYGPPSVVPEGARLIAARGQMPKGERAASSNLDDPTSGEWLQKQTKRLVDLISAPDVPIPVLLFALLAALVLGALHAFSPGHGKTIVGAYLIGSRSTPRHAVILGVTVTITHTLMVFVVGALTLFASRYILPERLFPILSLVSGVLVLGMGIVLVRQRWPVAHRALGRALVGWFERQNDDTPPVAAPLRRLPSLAAAGGIRYGLRPPGTAKHIHGHGHGHGHGHENEHEHDGHHHHHAHGPAGTMHSHGGRMHTHMPPGAAGEKVTWRSLIALGVSGGLVPCPSAMVLLLAAVALNKTFYGLVLVVAFSVGLALTLIAVGMAFLYARGRVTGPMRFGNLADLLPAASGVFITLIGLFLCYGALTSTGLATIKG